jgi:hypothetical protein
MPDGEDALSSFHSCQDYNGLATILNHHNIMIFIIGLEIGRLMAFIFVEY